MRKGRTVWKDSGDFGECQGFCFFGSANGWRVVVGDEDEQVFSPSYSGLSWGIYNMCGWGFQIPAVCVSTWRHTAMSGQVSWLVITQICVIPKDNTQRLPEIYLHSVDTVHL